jgi:hypothetical protein
VSKRANDAYNDASKCAETELIAIISKITGDDKELVLKALRTIIVEGLLEWHHVGRGKGKKRSKEYFYNATQIVMICERYETVRDMVAKKILLTEKAKAELPVLEKELDELESNTKTFTRVTNIPDGFTTITHSEMRGKYGWFDSNRRYNLPEYYSGFIFETKEQRERYYFLKEEIERLRNLINS